jgi:uncharacterized protein YjbI with pentapeptide repeats
MSLIVADEAHLEILREGVEAWNRWRKDEQAATPDLARANLSGASLVEANLVGVNLHGADLHGADLTKANLIGADLRKADLSGTALRGAELYAAVMCEANLRGADAVGADLSAADLTGADLRGANLAGADLAVSNLTGADLTGADLTGVSLVRTTTEQAILSRAHVYGTAVWNVKGTPADQRDLVITATHESVVTVDDLEVAQFIYLLLHNEKLRDVIDSITSKVVLILGRFTDERKHVLDRLRDELRNHNLSPVLFDFDVPTDRNVTETVTLLARMARFVIADLTDPRSIPQELQAFVPDVAVPVQPIILAGQDPWSMFPDLQKYPWMLEPYVYTDLEGLLENLETKVIKPANDRRDQRAAPGNEN